MPLTTLRKTPGVYVEEISIFPPSVAPVETAIPAFIGYTEKAIRKEEDLTNVPTRITSLLEFERYFGRAKVEQFLFDVDFNVITNELIVTTIKKPELDYHLYYAMQMFFANGGGPCYIVSVGNFDAAIDFGTLTTGVDAVEKVDEVTLLVSPDAVGLTPDQHTSLMNTALQQCSLLQDRFTIMDIKGAGVTEHDTALIGAFRNKVSSRLDEVKYGAVYYPYLETILNFNYTADSVQIRNYTEGGKVITGSNVDTLRTTLKEAVDTVNTKKSALEAAKIALATAKKSKEIADKIKATLAALPDETDTAGAKTALINLLGEEDDIPADIKTSIDAEADIATIRGAADTYATSQATNVTTKEGDVTTKEAEVTTAQAACDTAVEALVAEGDISYTTIDKIETSHNAIFNAIKQKLTNEIRVVLPPSSTIAGIYATVDRTRGVWKAPANESINFVVKPTIKITDREQDDLNVHVDGGKSVNAIRGFTGRGNLVWGARTLAGNDNEWRYVSVRRFFNFVEESVKKATSVFVFEPNSKNTWVKVKAMIENFLIVQWRAGALVGDKPEHAFFVKVGLNETMTAEDVLNGYMVVEIGMAVVRPAEFIILQFSHKMQES